MTVEYLTIKPTGGQGIQKRGSLGKGGKGGKACRYLKPDEGERRGASQREDTILHFRTLREKGGGDQANTRKGKNFNRKEKSINSPLRSLQSWGRGGEEREGWGHFLRGEGSIKNTHVRKGGDRPEGKPKCHLHLPSGKEGGDRRSNASRIQGKAEALIWVQRRRVKERKVGLEKVSEEIRQNPSV